MATTRSADPDDIGDYLLSGRAFDEYRDFFALTPDDLRGRILDCPGGVSEFTSRACGLGADAVAVDPVYAGDPAEIAARGRAELDRGSVHTAAGLDRYCWGRFGDLAGHRRVRAASVERFARDLVLHPSRYQAGALPELPFPDRSFDLVLSSHLLFTYANRLSPAFHLTALLELHRVARREVRIFPLLDQGGHPLPILLGDLRQALLVRHIASEIRTVPYEFQRGGNEMLVLGVRR